MAAVGISAMHVQISLVFDLRGTIIEREPSHTHL